jgi:hypothetical protein
MVCACVLIVLYMYIVIGNIDINYSSTLVKNINSSFFYHSFRCGGLLKASIASARIVIRNEQQPFCHWRIPFYLTRRKTEAISFLLDLFSSCARTIRLWDQDMFFALCCSNAMSGMPPILWHQKTREYKWNVKNEKRDTYRLLTT